MVPTDFEMVGRLALASFLGGSIGLERETHHQPAGFRTHMIVSLGAALIMLVSLYMAKNDPPRADPGRIAAQVVAGIGFLGAGAIMRFGMSVKGLTTAASIWTAAGIGLAAGCGYWKAATVATLFTLVALFVFDKLEKVFFRSRTYRRFVVRAKDAPGFVGRLEETLRKEGVDIKEIHLEREVSDRRLEVTIMATCPQKADVDTLSRALCGLSDVEKVDID